MNRMLSLTDVCRQTGLTARTLRYYELRGLLSPVRAANGRRLYSAGELVRLQQVLALKQGGFTLEKIAALIARTPSDLGRMIEAQIDALREQQGEIARALAGLTAASETLKRGDALDVMALCQIINIGETAMTQESWKKVVEKQFSAEEQAHWAKNAQALPPDFDQNAYMQRWMDLGARIEKALPLAPQSATAQAFLKEWSELLAPFNAVADQRMKTGAASFYDRMGEWEGEVKSPFSQAVWAFIKAASAARLK